VFDDEVEIACATPSGPLTEYRGVDGFLEGWAEWMAPWAGYRPPG
jgi:hypothetical protein